MLGDNHALQLLSGFRCEPHVRHMVFVGNVQKSPIASHLKITSGGEEGAGRYAGRLPVCLSNIVITSRGVEGAGRCAGRLPMCLSTL